MRIHGVMDAHVAASASPGHATGMPRRRPCNAVLAGTLRSDPARLRIRAREGERRKRRHSRARRRATEQREGEA